MEPTHVCSMPKTVQFSDKAYATLKALKRDGESFSDTILRMAASQKDPLALLNLPAPDFDWDYTAIRRTSNRIDRERLRDRGLLRPKPRKKTRSKGGRKP